MHHFVTEMCTCVHISVTKWCIVGYDTGTLWDLWDGSIGLGYLWYDMEADSRFAPSQWEMALLCNKVSDWLGTSLEFSPVIWRAAGWHPSRLLLMAKCCSSTHGIVSGHAPLSPMSHEGLRWKCCHKAEENILMSIFWCCGDSWMMWQLVVVMLPGTIGCQSWNGKLRS